MNVGQNIKKYRKSIGLTQKQLAQKLNKTESVVRMWELGKNEPSLGSLLMMRELFDITLDELVD